MRLGTTGDPDTPASFFLRERHPKVLATVLAGYHFLVTVLATVLALPKMMCMSFEKYKKRV